MPNLETIYRRLPVTLQNVACSWQGWRINRRRYNSNFLELLADYETRLNWSAEELRLYRDQRLREFVANAAKHVPFYRARFKECGVDPFEICTLSDLQQLPVLSRQEVQAAGMALHAEKVPASSKIMAHTSGTSGTGLRFPITFGAEQEQWAVWWRYRRALGIEFEQVCAVFGGRPIVPVDWRKPPYWRYNRAAKQILFSGYHLSAENACHYITELLSSGVSWLHGYPSQLTLLAEYVNSASGAASTLKHQITHVTIGAESLLAHQREAINKAFRVSVRQHYGLAEGVANISECPAGHLHVDEDFSAVEFVKRADGRYAIIGTNFTNLAYPLLRYDTGDIVEFADIENASCGFHGRIVQAIDGRVEDYVLLANGSRIGRLDHIFKDMMSIREAQIYQRVAGTIEIRVVRGPNYQDSDERQLLEETRTYCGADLQIEIKYLDSLPRSSSGKLRFVISEIDEASILAGSL